MIDRERSDRLNAIGEELDEFYFCGKLDFANFKRLFEMALAACGEDTDDLEMFMAMARQPGWAEWIWERLAAHRASRVA
jgi:hypothetical protein